MFSSNCMFESSLFANREYANSDTISVTTFFRADCSLPVVTICLSDKTGRLSMSDRAE